MIDLLFYLRLFFTSAAWDIGLFTQHKQSIYEIDFDQLNRKGITVVIFDVDDTLRGHLDGIPKKSITLLEHLGKNRFTIILFSNMTSQQRIDVHKKLKGIPIIFSKLNNKPNPRGYFDLFEEYNLKADHVVMIGDRIGVDMFGAYLAGVPERILVEPYSHIFGALKAPFYIRMMRALENKLFFR